MATSAAASESPLFSPIAMTTWTLNGSSLSALGLRIVYGHFQVQGVSTMHLERAVEFDAVEAYGYGAAVSLVRDGIPYFQGKVTSTPKYGDAGSEGQTMEISDAWADFEETIYQEEWATGTTPILQPRAVLGLGKISGVWTHLTVAQQVQKVVEYAISQGVAIQLGSVPTGERLLPTEVSNISCAEALQMALKFHPDWIPWIDHATTPPTLNVTPIGSATGAAFSVDGSGPVSSFEVTARQDLLPASVRIIYESADEIAGDVYRKIYVDKYPLTGPDGGPQVLTANIPLEGQRSQIQKTRVKTRLLPTSRDNALAWIKGKFPQLAAVADADLFVSTWSLELVTEAVDPLLVPISPQVSSLEFTPGHPEECTHELVKGTMEDWMRKKVGPVRVYFGLTCLETASAAVRKMVAALPSAIIITGTNCPTKTFKSISHWSAPEDVPTGIAESVYRALHASMPYQGSVSIVADELPGVPYHGRVISLPPTWAAMAAPVHSASWDAASGTMTLGFGPAPHLAPADFLEMQRILRARPVTWWSFAERDSGMLGHGVGPSALGDTVGGHHAPTHEPAAQVSIDRQFEVSRPFYDTTASVWRVRVQGGSVLTIDPSGTPVMSYVAVASATSLTITAASIIWCAVTTDKSDRVTSATISHGTSVPASTHAQPDPGGNTGIYYYRIAEFQTVSGNVEIAMEYHLGGPVIHRPARNNRNAKITIKHYIESTGFLVPNGSDTFMYFRQGLYVGTTDPGLPSGESQDTITLTESLPSS